MSGRVPSNAWHSMSPQNLGPSSYSGINGFGNQLPPRSAASVMPSNSVRLSDYTFSIEVISIATLMKNRLPNLVVIIFLV